MPCTAGAKPRTRVLVQNSKPHQQISADDGKAIFESIADIGDLKLSAKSSTNAEWSISAALVGLSRFMTHHHCDSAACELQACAKVDICLHRPQLLYVLVRTSDHARPLINRAMSAAQCKSHSWDASGTCVEEE